MRVIKILTLGLIGFMMFVTFGYCEVIYTKDGKEIRGKITEISQEIIWVEITAGDIVEYIGIDKVNVQKILNDDGTKYVYPKKDEGGGKK